MVKPFRKIPTSDPKLNLVQDALKEVLDQVTRSPWLSGQMLQQVKLIAGTNTVGHGLGRNYVSWAWLRPSAAATLYETESPDASRFLVLVASAPVTVDLFVL